MKKVILYGCVTFIKTIFYDSLDDDSFTVACFAMDKDYMTGTEFLGLPLVDFDEISSLYPPAEYDMLIAFSGYSNMREREKFYLKGKAKGYDLRNYISHRADVTPKISMGDNNIIFSNSHIGTNCIIGNNNIIRQNVYFGHDNVMGDNNTISPGANIGGKCKIKSTCFVGLGATVTNGITIEEETLIGAGSTVIKSTQPYSSNVGSPSRIIGYHKDDGIRMGDNNG